MEEIVFVNEGFHHTDKISKGEVDPKVKKEYKKIAEDLKYSKEAIRKIDKAKTEAEISRIMTDCRNGGGN